MSGSGTNRTVQSAMVDESESALTSALENANEVAIKKEKKGKKAKK